MAKRYRTHISNLPEQEEDLIARIRLNGPQLIDGKEWSLDECGCLHYVTIPTYTGTQLDLRLPDTHPNDSLFADSTENGGNP